MVVHLIYRCFIRLELATWRETSVTLDPLTPCTFVRAHYVSLCFFTYWYVVHVFTISYHQGMTFGGRIPFKEATTAAMRFSLLYAQPIPFYFGGNLIPWYTPLLMLTRPAPSLSCLLSGKALFTFLGCRWKFGEVSLFGLHITCFFKIYLRASCCPILCYDLIWLSTRLVRDSTP